MPELPEVETIARGLNQRIRGDTIDAVWIGGKPEPLKSPAAEIAATLEHARIEGVRRVGKHVVIDLKGPSDVSRFKRHSQRTARNAVWQAKAQAPRAQWIVHLGMTGTLLVVKPETQLPKHTHLVARLASGRELRFVDPRRFGRLSVARESGFQATGVEPLDVGFELFWGLFRKRKTPIKSALLNQKLLSGVGNIYADEALSRAGIRPRRRAASLTRAELHRLYQALQRVLKEAIAAGGSSISDYVDSNGDPGSFQFQHRVYGREGEPCIMCGTHIKRIVIAGRSSHYCPSCQE